MFIYEVVIFQILVFNISILILIWYDFLTPNLPLRGSVKELSVS